MISIFDSGSRAVLAQDGPETDEHPSWVSLDNRVVRARKSHPCDGCSGQGLIEKGERYQRLVVVEDGQLACIHMCLGPCRAHAEPHA